MLKFSGFSYLVSGKGVRGVGPVGPSSDGRARALPPSVNHDRAAPHFSSSVWNEALQVTGVFDIPRGEPTTPRCNCLPRKWFFHRKHCVRILIKQFFPHYIYLRSYLGERIRTHQNSEIKLLKAAVVMYWVTLREVAVMKVILFEYFSPRGTHRGRAAFI